MITERERIALLSMQGKMWVHHMEVGRTIYEQIVNHGGGNISSIGAAVLGRLRKRKLVAFLDDIQLWRITKAGEAALATPNPEATRTPSSKQD